jgi:hypothetical protein
MSTLFTFGRLVGWRTPENVAFCSVGAFNISPEKRDCPEVPIGEVTRAPGGRARAAPGRFPDFRFLPTCLFPAAGALVQVLRIQLSRAEPADYNGSDIRSF